MIKLVIFDNYGVVLHGGYPSTTEYLAKRFNRNQKEIYEIFYKKYFNLAAEAKITQTEAWRRAIEETNLPLTVEEVKKIHYHFFELNLPIIEFVKEINDKVNVLLLTKNTLEQIDAAEEKLRFKQYFPNMMNTWELRLSKASKETISYVLEKFGVYPSEVIYIDDQKENLTAAAEMGVNTILFENFLEVKKKVLSLLNQ